jgi:hypothetical protein
MFELTAGSVPPPEQAETIAMIETSLTKRCMIDFLCKNGDNR